MKFTLFKPFSIYIRPYRRDIALGLILLVGTQAIITILPMLLKWAIDTARSGEPMLSPSVSRDLALFAGAIAGLALLQWVLNFGMRWYLTSVARRIERDIRQRYVRHLLTLPLAFFQKRQVGDLMSRASNDLEAIQRFLSHAFRMTLTGILTFVLSLSLMATIDGELALYALSPMPIMIFSTRWVSARVRSGFRQVQEQFATMSAHIQENLAGVRVVKAFAQRRAQIARFDALNDEYVAKHRRLVYMLSLFFPFTFLLNSLAMLFILWLGGLRVIDGSLTLGAFVAFNAYLIRMSRPMMFLGRIVDEYQRASASMSRINAILKEAPQDRGSTEAQPLRGEIHFRHLSFAYDDQPALHDIELHVPAGSTLALVGRVGSGKTTLARLIPRLIQAEPGSLLIDGVPVEELPLTALRNGIGYVPQDTFLFSDTIAENIALGAQSDDGGLVQRAATIAQLSKDLEGFPEGIDTTVGERGVTLSGGQKQRTALARAIARQPAILILDDAMASVDTHTEEAILKGLRQVMAQRTTILIAHRLSTVKDADRIVVLDQGRIAETGTHDQLLARDGIYADMYRRQHLVEELSDL